MKKIEFIFGDIAMTITPNDIEEVLQKWEREHPGKKAELCLSGKEFSSLMIENIKSRARPARTVLHN
jgi:hypothetical protein